MTLQNYTSSVNQLLCSIIYFICFSFLMYFHHLYCHFSTILELSFHVRFNYFNPQYLKYENWEYIVRGVYKCQRAAPLKTSFDICCFRCAIWPLTCL